VRAPRRSARDPQAANGPAALCLLATLPLLSRHRRVWERGVAAQDAHWSMREQAELARVAVLARGRPAPRREAASAREGLRHEVRPLLAAACRDRPRDSTASATSETVMTTRAPPLQAGDPRAEAPPVRRQTDKARSGVLGCLHSQSVPCLREHQGQAARRYRPPRHVRRPAMLDICVGTDAAYLVWPRAV